MVSDVLIAVGLAFDLVGATLLAWDLFRKFPGARFEHDRDPFRYGLSPVVDGALPEETPEFKEWKSRLRKKKKFGVFLLICGFSLQGAALLV